MTGNPEIRPESIRSEILKNFLKYAELRPRKSVWSYHLEHSVNMDVDIKLCVCMSVLCVATKIAFAMALHLSCVHAERHLQVK